MAEINKIMVALAFSKNAEEIFKFGVKLAENLNSELVVANIINERDVNAIGKIVSMGYEVDGDHYVERVREEREALLGQYLEAAAFPKEKLRFIAKVGHPTKDLIKGALEENVNMIVMGTKGRSEIEYFLTGSVAEKVFRRSPITIVSYRSREESERLKKRILA